MSPPAPRPLLCRWSRKPQSRVTTPRHRPRRGCDLTLLLAAVVVAAVEMSLPVRHCDPLPGDLTATPEALRGAGGIRPRPVPRGIMSAQDLLRRLGRLGLRGRAERSPSEPDPAERSKRHDRKSDQPPHHHPRRHAADAVHAHADHRDHCRCRASHSTTISRRSAEVGGPTEWTKDGSGACASWVTWRRL